MQDKFFLAGATSVGIKFLSVFPRTQGAKSQGLSFATLKNCRTVSAWQQPDLTVDGANIVKPAAVEPFVMIHDQISNGFLLDVIKGVFEHEFGNFFLPEFFDQFFADFVGQRTDRRFTSEFARGQQSRDNSIARKALSLVENFLG